LCSLGGEKAAPTVQGWCSSWLSCIHDAAQPACDKAAVLAAWRPADCREVCGKWPAMKLAASPQNATQMTAAPAPAAPTFTELAEFGGVADCVTSCSNFQNSLSSCVATILFEPGKVAAMKPAEVAPPPGICMGNSTPCLPDLAIRHQKCISQRTAAVLGKSKASVASVASVASSCKALSDDLALCRECPQLADGYQSQYTAFVGGCMDQLNAYWQATHPSAGEVAVPSGSGCHVH